MNIKDCEDLSKVTIAQIHEAIANSEEEMQKCLKNKNIKGFLGNLKFYLKLNKILSKKTDLVRKENNMIEKQL